MKHSSFLHLIALTLALFIFTCVSSADEAQPNVRELYRIKLENIQNGNIYASADSGQSWLYIGRVKKPVVATNPNGFSASRFGEMGKVIATAVNAIHIKTGMNPKGNTGVVFSLLPDKVDVKGHSYFDEPSSLMTDILPQQGIFGGPFTPLVGSPIYLEQTDGTLRFMPPQYTPKEHDTFIIIVLLPTPYPQEILFENSFGGKITVVYPDRTSKVIGQVLKPVQGVGRFIGTQYSNLSRIRANHIGVIDISTSIGHGRVGGFQIIPAKHAMDPEMEKARTSTQWMVVGPLSEDDPGLEGTAPLFAYFIMPSYTEKDLQDREWKGKILTRTLVQVKLKGSSRWQTLPSYNFDPDRPLPPEANTALKDVKVLRILFPKL